MKTIYIILILIIITQTQTKAQYDIIYRTAASGNWTNPTIWERSTNSGTTWGPTVVYPQSLSDTDQVGPITIRHSVTISSDINATEIFINPGASITIQAGKNLHVRNYAGGGLNLDSGAAITGAGTVKSYSKYYSIIFINDKANFDINVEADTGTTQFVAPSSSKPATLRKKLIVDTTGDVVFGGGFGDPFHYYFYDEIINNGKIRSSYAFLHYKGPKITNNDSITVDIKIDTNSSIAGNGFWGSSYLTVNPGRTLTIFNNMTIDVNFLELEAGSFLNLNSKTLTFNSNYNNAAFKIDSAAITDTSGLIQTQGGNVLLYNYNGPFYLYSKLRVVSGTTSIQTSEYVTSVTFFNDVTIEPGAALSGSYIFRKGNIINNGTITGIEVFCKSPNLTNSGNINVANFNFDSVTNIQGSGTWPAFEIRIRDSKTVKLLSDFTFGVASFIMEKNSLMNLNSFIAQYAHNTYSNFQMDSNAKVINGLFKFDGQTSYWHTYTGFDVPVIIASNTLTVSNIDGNSSGFNSTLTIDSSAELYGNDRIAGNILNNGTITGVNLDFLGAAITNNGLVQTEFKFGGMNPQILSGSGSFGYICRITGNSNVAANSNHQLYELIIDSSGTFNISNRTISINGPSIPITNNGTFTTSGSTIEFNSQLYAQILPVQNINYDNIRINNSNNVMMNDDVSLPALITLLNGDIDLNTHIMTLTPTATLQETPGNTVKGLNGYIVTTRNLNSPSNLNVGGMGAVLTTTANLGMTEIRRGHSTAFINNVYSSVQRYFEITPANNSGLNATLRYKYDYSELDTLDESKLGLYKSTDGGLNYNFTGGTLDTANNQITLTGINDFSKWTAALGSNSAEITVAMEGFIAPFTMRLNSRDTVKVYLANVNSPYNFVDSSKSIIDSTTYKGLYNFNNASSGNYYIVVRHRNCVDTWSKAGGEVYNAGSLFTYDFTSSQSQAYGSNEAQVSAVAAIYSGDVDREGCVDVSDLIQVYNSARNLDEGYLPEDVSGDGTVDVSDLILVYNNSRNIVCSQTP